ncbi:MAG: hypothetical protein OXR64_12355 [Chloroflexota bacterium]|nr:hypothetical protein [Chloroflexota bacterium]MDE2920617.1 hypothetical protein [Chloroflexota bacterium]
MRSAISTPEPADQPSTAAAELTVTPEAALALHTALQDANGSDEQTRAIRISLDTSNRMRLSVSDIWKGDRKVVFDGRIILVAEPEVADALGGRTLAIQTAGGRSSFALRPTQDSAT